jgi:hypothetical protein
VVAKHFWKTPPPAQIGLLRSVRDRRFGETTLTFLRWESAAPADLAAPVDVAAPVDNAAPVDEEDG